MPYVLNAVKTNDNVDRDTGHEISVYTLSNITTGIKIKK